MNVIGSNALVVVPSTVAPLARPAPLTPGHAEARETADDCAERAKATSTRRAYAAAWTAFEAWTAEQGRSPFPADGDLVADYIGFLAREGLKPATVEVYLSALSVAYAAAGFPGLRQHPRVKAVREGFQRSHGVAQRKAAPMAAGELRASLAALPATLGGTRDRALLLLGFAGALRRSELVALDVADVRPVADGMVMRIRRSKTDQKGVGCDLAIPFGASPEVCPVAALRAWLDAAGIVEGPLFRSVGKAGRVSAERLSDRSVALIVKAAADRAGLDAAAFSGHSLRAGFTTAAARAGRALPNIMRQTRHVKAETVLGYIREADLFKDNAGAGLL